MKNRQWRIAQRPIGRSLLLEDFIWSEGDAVKPAEGEVLVRVDYFSFDPAQKGWMENVADYVAPSEIGDPMPAFAMGEVIESRDPRFATGDRVSGRLSWQDYATVPGVELSKLPDDGYQSEHLGILGISGMTAFFGLHRIGNPIAGDTIVITGAAGAIGSAVGQLAKLAGCRVIGVAGGEKKCRWLTEDLGFDGAIDYKVGNVRREARALAPNGIDILWDNVGGAIFNDLLPRLANKARVVLCGAISIYAERNATAGPSNYMQLIFRRARMEGFIALDYAAEFPWARDRLTQWLREGRLTHREDLAHGLENAPATLMRLFSGNNMGKLAMKVR